MLHFEGERSFSHSPDQLWLKLRDAAFLASSIPDSTTHSAPTRDKAECTVHPGLSFMRGNLDVTLELIDAQEPATLRFSVKSKGVGSNSEVETALTLSPDGQGTKVRWVADVKTLGGLLKMIPSGLIRGAANKVIEDVWTGVMENLQQNPA